MDTGLQNAEHHGGGNAAMFDGVFPTIHIDDPLKENDGNADLKHSKATSVAGLSVANSEKIDLNSPTEVELSNYGIALPPSYRSKKDSDALQPAKSESSASQPGSKFAGVERRKRDLSRPRGSSPSFSNHGFRHSDKSTKKATEAYHHAKKADPKSKLRLSLFLMLSIPVVIIGTLGAVSAMIAWTTQKNKEAIGVFSEELKAITANPPAVLNESSIFPFISSGDAHKTSSDVLHTELILKRNWKSISDVRSLLAAFNLFITTKEAKSLIKTLKSDCDENEKHLTLENLLTVSSERLAPLSNSFNHVNQSFGLSVRGWGCGGDEVTKRNSAARAALKARRARLRVLPANATHADKLKAERLVQIEAAEEQRQKDADVTPILDTSPAQILSKRFKLVANDMQLLALWHASKKSLKTMIKILDDVDATWEATKDQLEKCKTTTEVASVFLGGNQPSSSFNASSRIRLPSPRPTLNATGKLPYKQSQEPENFLSHLIGIDSVNVDTIVPPSIALGLYGSTTAEDFFGKVLSHAKQLADPGSVDLAERRLASLLVEHSDPSVVLSLPRRYAEIQNRSVIADASTGTLPDGLHPESSPSLAMRELAFREYGLLLPIHKDLVFKNSVLNSEAIIEAMKARIAAGKLVAPVSGDVSLQSDTLANDNGLKYDQVLENARKKCDTTRSVAFRFVLARLQAACAVAEYYRRINNETAAKALTSRRSLTICIEERSLSGFALNRTPETFYTAVGTFRLDGKLIDYSGDPRDAPVPIPFSSLKFSVENGFSVILWGPISAVEDAYIARPL
eukprot:GHVT01086179.1.p1 GENE.GHVT01086179.1~~GHVT01086179.1.p1  ORF type:complete len:798 (+),score=51.35 GHVT01086179.1:549-2942(+)